MKLIAAMLLIVALVTMTPSVSQAQVRVHVNIGFGRYHPYGYSGRYYPRAYPVGPWHARSCYSYSRYGCYPGEVVIVRRPFHPGRGIAVRSHYRAVRPRYDRRHDYR